MVRATLKEADSIERKPHTPQSDRTPARDEVADWIDANIVNGEYEWAAMTMTDIAEEVDRSREHVATVLDDYFRPADRDDDVPEILRDADVPPGGEEGGFAAGYRAGYWDGLTDALQNVEELRRYLDE